MTIWSLYIKSHHNFQSRDGLETRYLKVVKLFFIGQGIITLQKLGMIDFFNYCDSFHCCPKKKIFLADPTGQVTWVHCILIGLTCKTLACNGAFPSVVPKPHKNISLVKCSFCSQCYLKTPSSTYISECPQIIVSTIPPITDAIRVFRPK